MTNWVERLTGETTSKLLSLLRRSRLTITALADALHLTDNAVRTHIAALERDGIVEHVGTQRETGGKPARVYALTGEGEELFPKAYALVLGGLVEEIARADGWERATALLRAVGQRDRGIDRTLGWAVDIVEIGRTGMREHLPGRLVDRLTAYQRQPWRPSPAVEQAGGQQQPQLRRHTVEHIDPAPAHFIQQ